MQRSGWAYGERGVWNVGEHKGEQSRYLTIIGSAHKRPVLHDTRELAEAALGASPASKWTYIHLEVAHVTEVQHGGVSGGYAYPITGAFDAENS
jgi:hypothetical protein